MGPMSLDLRDQMALQFASALARDDEDARAVAERAYELADAMLRRRRELSATQHEAELDDAIPAYAEGLAPVGEDPRGYEPAPLDWMREPTWTQMPLFERAGLLDDVPPPPSERDFGEPAEPYELAEEELAAPYSEREYDPRWEAKPQWVPQTLPGLASTRPAVAGKKATG